MIDRELNIQLSRVARRVRSYRLWSGLGIAFVLAALLGGSLYLWNRSTGAFPQSALNLVLGVSAIGALLAILVAWRSGRNAVSLARRIESRFPELNSSLLTAIEQQPQTSTGRFGYLQQSVINKAMLHARVYGWQNLISRERMVFARVSAIGGFVLLVLWTQGLISLPRAESGRSAEQVLAFDDVALDGGEYSVSVEPGDAEIERGASLLVRARFENRLPLEASIVYQTEDGEERSVAMKQSLDDPLFGGRISAISKPLTYHVRFGNQTSEEFQVTVFEYPLALRTDARLVFPSYTNQAEKFVQDVRRVSAVEGTELTLLCRVNKPLVEAHFVEETRAGTETIPLEVDASDPLTYVARLTVDRSRKLELHLTDEAGRTNRHPPEFTINVIVNRPPDIKLVQPTRDLEVSPIEEVDLIASAWDDFGLQRVGISYMIPGSIEQELVLGDTFPAKERIQVEHLLALEDLQAEPDQLLTWYFWAEDVGPDGNIRRTSSDMFFAEVRPFEEVFRQGQQPPDGSQQQQQQQGSQNAQAAEQLAELQKQIINATWKIIRRETRGEPTSSFVSDTTLLWESQQDALSQVQELEQNLQDQQSLTYVDAVKQEMQKAIVSLDAARNGPSIDALQPALGSEQAAYQGLLKLRAREFEVTRGSQSQQSSQSSQQNQNSRSQQQLQQLQLREDEERYATEQLAQAQTEEQQAAREDRQVLNRLRELAQRQNDLNERIKELQSALEAAETEEEKAEAERQLKRLREEQQEILRDAEELQERMQSPENQERMAEQSQQLEQARENVRQSSEALEQGMVTQAANEGTRAERELSELQDEFRKRTSGQFDEQMREMREQARELDRKEQELAEQLKALGEPRKEPSTSLRDTGEREQAERALAEQRERLENLLERMRQTIDAAEESQPLLAEQLYESIRETRTQDPGEALEQADRSLRRGFLDDAVDQEAKAREGITQLADGVERAAENILGDEAETLRRALQELERLNSDLEGEIARAEGREPSEQQPGESQSGEREPGEGQPGQRPPGEPQAGTRPGEQPGQQPGQQQPSQEQPGERPGAPPGDQPANQPGQQSGQNQPGQRRPGEQPPGDQPEQQPGTQPGQEPGEQPENQPGQQPGQQPGEQPGQQPGEQQPGQQPGGQQPGQRPSGQPGQQRPGSLDLSNLGGGGGGLDRFLDQDRGGARRVAPISGEDFLDWADRLRDVEEIIDDPELRAEAARIRDEAKAIRKDVKRNSQPPNWDLVRDKVANPLSELKNRVADELLRKTADDALVPIDRDPVPIRYETEVRRYYERLGRGSGK